MVMNMQDNPYSFAQGYISLFFYQKNTPKTPADCLPSLLMLLINNYLCHFTDVAVEPVNTCGTESYFCPQSRQCILLAYLCDGIEDCSKGEDEAKDLCGRSWH